MVLTFPVEMFDHAKMFYRFVYGFFGIGDCVKVPRRKYCNDKPPVKIVVIHLGQQFWQAQHEWGEATIHYPIQVVEQDDTLHSLRQL
jgi:hypothetical protein